jgi:hypothetical protein
VISVLSVRNIYLSSFDYEQILGCKIRNWKTKMLDSITIKGLHDIFSHRKHRKHGNEIASQ